MSKQATVLAVSLVDFPLVVPRVTSIHLKFELTAMGATLIEALESARVTALGIDNEPILTSYVYSFGGEVVREAERAIADAFLVSKTTLGKGKP